MIEAIDKSASNPRQEVLVLDFERIKNWFIYTKMEAKRLYDSFGTIEFGFLKKKLEKFLVIIIVLVMLFMLIKICINKIYFSRNGRAANFQK